MWLPRLPLVALAALLAAPAVAADTGRTVLEKGLFSYEAPPGWHVSDLNLSHPVSLAPLRDGFAANIHVDIVASALPLAGFVAENLRVAKSTADFRLVSEGPFSTAAELDGVRVVVTERVDARKLLQVFYFFDGGADQKIIVSASCLARDGAADEPLFDASLKTFSLE